MDARIRRQRTLEALKRILLRESLNQPLMVVFEDLHWIDEETQAFLNLLADSIGTAKLLVMVNYRPEYSHQWSGKTYYTQLPLDPLGKESASEMLDALLGVNTTSVDSRLYLYGNAARRKPTRPAAGWSADQVAERLIQGLERNEFYILCQDNETTRDQNERCILWAAGDLTERPSKSPERV
jgi:hypothetical protein